MIHHASGRIGKDSSRDDIRCVAHFELDLTHPCVACEQLQVLAFIVEQSVMSFRQHANAHGIRKMISEAFRQRIGPAEPVPHGSRQVLQRRGGGRIPTIRARNIPPLCGARCT
jgi:hypothetical protein